MCIRLSSLDRICIYADTRLWTAALTQWGPQPRKSSRAQCTRLHDTGEHASYALNLSLLATYG